MLTKEDILGQCIVCGNVIKLPSQQLDRKLYLEVAKALQLIGGKCKGGKIAGFVFENEKENEKDLSELLAQIAGGTCRDFKKEYQFFETLDALADRLVEMAQIQPGDAVLEPSAGQGAIVKAIQKKYSGTVDCFELMDINCSFLLKMEKVNLVDKDFLSYETMPKYDRIIANPPFSKNQDIDHIYRMFAWLRPGGCIVTIASKHWQISFNKKEKEFLEWLKSVNAEIIDIAPSTFKESGTMVGGCILKIKKCH